MTSPGAAAGQTATGVAPDVPTPTGAARSQRPRRSAAPVTGGVAGCLLLAVASWLLWPGAIGYDPLTWAVWGRELASGGLAIGAGDAVFKPVPVAVDAVAALLHLPVLQTWAVLLRAGTAGALLAAFLLGRRGAGVAAGVLAALALAALPRFLVWYSAITSVEPLEVLALLAAVDAAVRRRPGAVVLWLALLGGLRPEAWPLLVLAAAWAVRRQRRAGLWAVPVVLVTVGSWFAGEYLGSGRWSTGVARAGTPSLGGALLTPVPGWTVVREAWASLPTAWWPVAVLTVAGAVAFRVRRRRPADVPLLLGAVSLLWLATVAAMTQLRISAGEPRYLVGTTVCGAVLAATGAGAVLRELWRRPAGRAAAVVLAVLLAGYGGARAVQQGRAAVPEQARRYAEQADLARLLAPHDGVRACPRVATAPDQVPAVAWLLGRPLAAVGLVREPGAVELAPVAVPVPPEDRGRVGYRDTRWWVAGACR